MSNRKHNLDYFNQKHLVRDYLYDMHPYYDPHDIGGTVYNRSILKIRAEQERYKSNNNKVKANCELRYTDGHPYLFAIRRILPGEELFWTGSR